MNTVGPRRLELGARSLSALFRDPEQEDAGLWVQKQLMGWQNQQKSGCSMDPGRPLVATLNNYTRYLPGTASAQLSTLLTSGLGRPTHPPRRTTCCTGVRGCVSVCFCVCVPVLPNCVGVYMDMSACMCICLRVWVCALVPVTGHMCSSCTSTYVLGASTQARICVRWYQDVNLYICMYVYLSSPCLCLSACVLMQLLGPWLSFLSHIEIVKLHNLIVCLKFALGCRPVPE